KLTRIPGGGSLIGAHRNAVGGGIAKAHKTKRIKGFYSYLAISEIVKRSIEDNVFAPNKNDDTSKTDKIADVFYDLPQTAFISESTNTYYMNFQHQDFYKLKGEHWEKYIK
uniref:cellulose biosynthesis protein BcsG n=1 Tax=Succinivibrio sp. TaxID=2053619 RepID=UPI00402A7E48